MQQAETAVSNMFFCMIPMIPYFSLGLSVSNLCLLTTIFFFHNLSSTILVPINIVSFRSETSTTAESTKNGVHVLSNNDFHYSLQKVCMTKNFSPYFTLDKSS